MAGQESSNHPELKWLTISAVMSTWLAFGCFMSYLALGPKHEASDGFGVAGAFLFFVGMMSAVAVSAINALRNDKPRASNWKRDEPIDTNRENH